MPIYVPLPETVLCLDAEELKFIELNSTMKHRLTFAVMLKFFQQHGRYPTHKDMIDPIIIYSLANQLKLSPSLFEPIGLENRTGERFRKKIREFLGYKLATLYDSEQLISWLIEKAKSGPYTMTQYREKAHEFLKEQRVEPFTLNKLDRYVRAAIHRFEKQFFSEIVKKLSPESLKLMDDLLREEMKTNGAKKNNSSEDDITLRRLKADIAGVKLKHVAFEVKKLGCLGKSKNKSVVYSRILV